MRARTWPLLAGLAAVAAPTSAEVVDIPAAQDSTLYEEPFGTLANGAGEYFFAGRTDVGLIRRGVIRFDIASAIPDGSVITGATLTLHMSRTNTGPQFVSLHRAAASWVEGATDAPGEEGTGWPTEFDDVTWAHRLYDTLLWANPGGDFEPASSATTLVGGIDHYLWGGDGVAADVAAWAADPAANFGWAILGDEEFILTAKRFDSRSNPAAEFRPSLRIEYVPVPGPGACAALTVAAMCTFGRRRR